MPWLSTYTQSLTRTQAAHLLRRATFGPTAAQLRQFTGLKPAAAVALLLADQPTPTPPIDTTTGKTFVDLPFNNDLQTAHQTALKNWWLGLMINEGASAREKLTLFWQNHFVSTYATVSDARYLYRQLVLIRQYAMGNFRQFVIDMTKDPAMLRYLNGNVNVANKPNENYGRELQELFTIGLGGQYTEDDVKAATRVLTGWADTGFRSTTSADITVAFRSNQHDTGNKQFSAAYGNYVVKGRTGNTAGDEELADMVDMILRQPETARFLVRKLYRFFVCTEITPAVETNVIEPLAKIYRDNKYELKPVLTTLFTSDHFYDESVRGAIIRSPLELLVGQFRFAGLKTPEHGTTAFNQLGDYLRTRAREQQMDVYEQPTVFGYPPYYDTGLDRIWISANTLALRSLFTDQFIRGQIRYNNVTYGLDSVEVVRALSNPGDPVQMMDELTDLVFAVPLAQSQKDFLIDQVLVPGLPRYEWPAEWNDYAQSPTNAKRMSVKIKLDNLFLFMYRMAEFQMS
ncbi:DUF1800 domain-containing protein [Rudanella lutea]|uniref:DUF1800 domain-containing protein n=1 Tax=Rudanella lutea TaxID=451374 RepID=UPI000379555F|nr:DUF1800 domain-containing protein [Rudanella lutea]